MCLACCCIFFVLSKTSLVSSTAWILDTTWIPRSQTKTQRTTWKRKRCQDGANKSITEHHPHVPMDTPPSTKDRSLLDRKRKGNVSVIRCMLTRSGKKGPDVVLYLVGSVFANPQRRKSAHSTAFNIFKKRWPGGSGERQGFGGCGLTRVSRRPRDAHRNADTSPRHLKRACGPRRHQKSLRSPPLPLGRGGVWVHWRRRGTLVQECGYESDESRVEKAGWRRSVPRRQRGLCVSSSPCGLVFARTRVVV